MARQLSRVCVTRGICCTRVCSREERLVEYLPHDTGQNRADAAAQRLGHRGVGGGARPIAARRWGRLRVPGPNRACLGSARGRIGCLRLYFGAANA